MLVVVTVVTLVTVRDSVTVFDSVTVVTVVTVFVAVKVVLVFPDVWCWWQGVWQWVGSPRYWRQRH